MGAVLAAASKHLFAPAAWSGSGTPVRLFQGGGDVEFEMFGETSRRATHWFRGIKAELVGLGKGQILTVDGEQYTILDFRTPADAPLEWEIAAAEKP